MKIIKIILLSLMLFIPPLSANAQNLSGGNSKEPIEITADETLEWFRNDKKFIAQKNVTAKQGTVSISSETLSANYREAPGSDFEIYKMIATENVIITSQENKAYGEKATYDVDEGLAVMTGENLRMVAPDQTLTARDKFEYWVEDGRITALGDATIIRPKPTGGTDTLRADKISALLKENDKGERVLHSMEAIGNVVITTPTEVITGAYGIYKTQSNKAEITGNVVIKRGPNILEGEKAEVDLTTNTSRMFANPKTGTQVRGIFYPGSGQAQEE